jgi:uncharacterized protein
VVAVDTNILVYAHREDSEWHSEAKDFLLELANGGELWAIPWPCYHEFISVVTHPKIYLPPTPVKQAVAFLEGLRGSRRLHSLSEGPGYFEKMKSLAISAKLKGAKIHDCRIAAICQNHGVKVLYSADRDFNLFPSLKCINPLL